MKKHEIVDGVCILISTVVFTVGTIAVLVGYHIWRCHEWTKKQK